MGQYKVISRLKQIAKAVVSTKYDPKLMFLQKVTWHTHLQRQNFWLRVDRDAHKNRRSIIKIGFHKLVGVTEKKHIFLGMKLLLSLMHKYFLHLPIFRSSDFLLSYKNVGRA